MELYRQLLRQKVEQQLEDQLLGQNAESLGRLELMQSYLQKEVEENTEHEIVIEEFGRKKTLQTLRLYVVEADILEESKRLPQLLRLVMERFDKIP